MNQDETADIVYLKPEYARHCERRDTMTTELSHKIGLVLHVDDALGEARRSDIETALESEQGICSARFTERRPHLILVEYDPDLMSSTNILDRVNRQSVHAELIGPV